MSKSISI
jgi:hypothetical protein